MIHDIRVSPAITERWQLALLANDLGLKTAIELGVHRADFAANFLAHWQGERYSAVDLYGPTEDYNWDRQQDRTIAHNKLRRFKDRVTWIEDDTLTALRSYRPGSLDFIYIDAAHLLWAVQAEIKQGWEVLRPGGILAGHDFDWHCPDVCYAVREFSAREQVTVYLTQDSGQPWSWYAHKPQTQLETPA